MIYTTLYPRFGLTYCFHNCLPLHSDWVLSTFSHCILVYASGTVLHNCLISRVANETLRYGKCGPKTRISHRDRIQDQLNTLHKAMTLAKLSRRSHLILSILHCSYFPCMRKKLFTWFQFLFSLRSTQIIVLNRTCHLLGGKCCYLSSSESLRGTECSHPLNVHESFFGHRQDILNFVEG